MYGKLTSVFYWCMSLVTWQRTGDGDSYVTCHVTEDRWRWQLCHSNDGKAKSCGLFLSCRCRMKSRDVVSGMFDGYMQNLFVKVYWSEWYWVARWLCGSIMCALESVQLVVFIFTTESVCLGDVESSWSNVGLNRVMHILHEIDGCTK